MKERQRLQIVTSTRPSQPMSVGLYAESVSAFNADLTNFFAGPITVARLESSETGYWRSYEPW